MVRRSVLAGEKNLVFNVHGVYIKLRGTAQGRMLPLMGLSRYREINPLMQRLIFPLFCGSADNGDMPMMFWQASAYSCQRHTAHRQVLYDTALKRAPGRRKRRPLSSIPSTELPVMITDPACIVRTLTLIGVPTDIGAGSRGASMGPEALRVAGLAPALQSLGYDVIDIGNLVGPANPDLPPDAGYRHLDEVTSWNRTLHDAVYAVLADGRLPITLGGDHCLAIGSISAVARHCHQTGKPLRVVWLDAHTDFNTRALTPSGNLHGMPVACLCGHGPEVLTTLSGQQPALHPGWVRQIGIRSVDEGEKGLIAAMDIEVYDMRTIDEIGMRSVMEAALGDLTPHTHLHVSFDVDFLDPEIAPAVATSIPGGPTYREAQLCMEMIADTGCLGSLDIVELNPALDIRNKTARLATELVQSLFGKTTLIRRPTR